jgi:DNA-binding transcriptional LysR family regulator
MARVALDELDAFVAVAEHRSFTRAAGQVGLSLSTVSQTIRGLEERLGVRLFNRTTRSVALTAAGARFLAEIQPILRGLDSALDAVNSFREKPMGALRLAVGRPFATLLVAPLVQPFLAQYPEIELEIVVDDSRSDIVAGGFDAGIRIGHQVDRDMTIVRIADRFSMLAVASPGYLQGREPPAAPADLHAHDCIRYRVPWDGALVPWIFSRDREEIEINVAGPLTVNDVDLFLGAILGGAGIGYLPEPIAAPHLAQGRLVNVLDGWKGERTGVFLYHPSRRQTPAPLQVFIKFLESHSYVDGW